MDSKEKVEQSIRELKWLMEGQARQIRNGRVVIMCLVVTVLMQAFIIFTQWSNL